MLRAAFVVLVVLSSFSSAAAAAPGAAPEYSPLPPPPPPPADLAAKPRVASPLPPAKPANPPVVPAFAPATTTTSSASLPAAEPSPRETTPRSHPELDDERFSVSPLLGFGTNNLELGVGVRAGAVAFAPHLWVGGTFLFHNGTSRSGAVAGVPYSAGSSVIYFGPEVGYDFALGPVLLRPYGGVGPALFSVSASSANVSTSDTATKLLFWTGGAVLYGIPGSRFFVGGDARMVTVPAGPAFALYALGGLTF